MVKLSKADMSERLEKLDRDAFLLHPDDEMFSLIVVGGSALILGDYTQNVTKDIDVLSATRDLYELFWKYDMNGDVAAYMNSFPLNYEDRLVLLMRGKKIMFYSPSLEDLVISKLCGGRPTDFEDLNVVADRVDWDLLEKLASSEDELKANIMNESNYFYFMENYKDYVERYKP